MGSKTVSLVMGTYNPNKEWLNDALESSDRLFDETIIVDDGSNVPLDNYVVEARRIYHARNAGFYEARNTGCRNVQSEWIAALDDDDEFIRENVKELKEFLKTTDADIVHFPVELFGEQTGYWGHNANMDNILLNNQIPSGSWFKKEVWEKVKFKLPTAEDWDFWARAKKHGFKFAYFQKPVYRHRMRSDSLSGQWVGDKFLEIREQVRQNYDKEII